MEQQQNLPVQNNSQEKGKEEVDIFGIAFNQRRRINLQKLSQYMKNRSNSYIQRQRIYLLLQGTLVEKMESSKSFVKEFIKFFQDCLSWYEVIFKYMDKFELSNKDKSLFQYQTFHKIALQMTELNKVQEQELRQLTKWIDKTLLPALIALYNMFRDQTKVIRKDLEAVFNNSQAERHRQNKLFMKIQENNDLLENQIDLLNKLQISNKATISWGQKIYASWEKLFKQEDQVRELLRNNIIQFNRKLSRVYNETETSKNIWNYWSQLPKSPSIRTVFCSIMDQKDVQFIQFGSSKKKFQNKFEQFVKLIHEQNRVGNPLPLLQILQNKKFKCRVLNGKKDRQWIQTKLYFTVDLHILLFDFQNKKMILKIKSRGVKGKRISQNTVQMSGVEEGMIFDSTKKQLLHFQTMDQVEQFIYYIQNLIEENQPHQVSK